MRDKRIAYVDRQHNDEIVEVGTTDVLPRRGQVVTINGDRCTVYDVRQVADPVFAAIVEVERPR